MNRRTKLGLLILAITGGYGVVLLCLGCAAIGRRADSTESLAVLRSPLSDPPAIDGHPLVECSAGAAEFFRLRVCLHRNSKATSCRCSLEVENLTDRELSLNNQRTPGAFAAVIRARPGYSLDEVPCDATHGWSCSLTVEPFSLSRYVFSQGADGGTEARVNSRRSVGIGQYAKPPRARERRSTLDE